jgi:hypothetical protein
MTGGARLPNGSIILTKPLASLNPASGYINNSPSRGISGGIVKRAVRPRLEDLQTATRQPHGSARGSV